MCRKSSAHSLLTAGSTLFARVCRRWEQCGCMHNKWTWFCIAMLMTSNEMWDICPSKISSSSLAKSFVHFKKPCLNQLAEICVHPAIFWSSIQSTSRSSGYPNIIAVLSSKHDKGWILCCEALDRASIVNSSLSEPGSTWTGFLTLHLVIFQLMRGLMLMPLSSQLNIWFCLSKSCSWVSLSCRRTKKPRLNHSSVARKGAT